MALLAISAATAAFAQSDRQRENQERQKQNQNQNQAKRNAQLIEGTEIMSCTVVSEDNQNLGKVQNLALDMDNSRALYVIVDNADNDKLIPVPLAALNFSQQGQRARVNIDKQRWQDSPDFEESNWQSINDPNWVRIVFQHYGLETPFNANQTQRMDIAKATDVIGMKCVDRDNRDQLGQCKDFLIQDRTAMMPFIVIEAERGNGNERNVAVPTQLVNLSKNDKTLVLRTEAQALANAPVYNQGAMENQTQFAQRVFDHFNVQGDVYGYTSPRDDQDQNQNSNDRNNSNNNSNKDSWQTNSRYGQLYDTGNIVTVEGRVTRVERITPVQGMEPGVALIIEGNNNRTHTVHLGPAWFMERQQNQFSNGDQVRITGSRAKLQNEQFIMANIVEEGNRAMLLRDRKGVPAWDAWHTAGDLRDSNIYPDTNRNRDFDNDDDNNNDD